MQDQLERSILLCTGWFFNSAVAAIHFFRGYMEQINFDSSYLLRAATFLEERSHAFHFFKDSLFINCSHPSLEIVYMYLSQKEWQTSIIWNVLYLLWQENLHSSIFWVILSAVACLFSKKVSYSCAFYQMYYNYFYRIAAAIYSFNGAVHFSDIQFCQRTFFQRISEHLSTWNRLPIEAAMFSKQHQFYWDESSHLNSCFFLITTSW